MARMNSSHSLRMMYGILGAAGLAGVMLVLWGTSKYGMGTSPDAVAYLSAARSVAQGRGFTLYDGGYYQAWPPLFPLLLAAGVLLSGDLSASVRCINAVSFGLIIVAGGLLSMKRIGSRVLILAAVLSLLVSVPLLAVSVMAWSEPLYILLSLGFFLTLDRVPVSPRWLLLGAVCAAGACLQRYVGVTVLMTGVCTLLVYDRRSPLGTKVARSVLFGVVAGMPLVLWLARNYSLTGRFAGFRFPAYYGVMKNLSLIPDTLRGWFFPPDSSLPALQILIALLPVLGALLIMVDRKKGKDTAAPPSFPLLASVSLYCIFYGAFLVGSSSLYALEPINDRLLVPLYPFILLLLLYALDRLRCRLSKWVRPDWVPQACIAGLLAVQLSYPLQRTMDALACWREEGAGEEFYGESYYGKKAWQESPLLQWLRHHPLHGRIYSNEPDALYAVAGVTAVFGPVRSGPLPPQRPATARDEAQFLVWCKDNLNGKKRFLHRKAWVYPLETIVERCELEEVAIFADGGVYRFGAEKRGGAAQIHTHG